MSKSRARKIAEPPCLLRQRLGDRRIGVAQVRDKGAAAGIEVWFAGIVVQVAPFPAHDAPVGAIELPVEHMAVGIPVCRHRPPTAGESAESYGAGCVSASTRRRDR